MRKEAMVKLTSQEDVLTAIVIEYKNGWDVEVTEKSSSLYRKIFFVSKSSSNETVQIIDKSKIKVYAHVVTNDEEYETIEMSFDCPNVLTDDCIKTIKISIEKRLKKEQIQLNHEDHCVMYFIGNKGASNTDLVKKFYNNDIYK